MMNLDFLERVDLFRDLDDNRLEHIVECSKVVEFKRGELIFAAGQNADFLWAVKEGQVELKEDDAHTDNQADSVISVLSEAMAFGWSSLVSPHKYYFSAYCVSRTCKLLQIERDCLIRIMEEDMEMGYPVVSRLLALVGQRFDQLEEKLIERLGRDIINKW